MNEMYDAYDGQESVQDEVRRLRVTVELTIDSRDHPTLAGTLETGIVDWSTEPLSPTELANEFENAIATGTVWLTKVTNVDLLSVETLDEAYPISSSYDEVAAPEPLVLVGR